jgi:hypothetical protein
VTYGSATSPGRRRQPAEIDTSVAHVARAYDYMLGGVTNFEVDRQAAERLSEVFPGGTDTARRDVRAQRDFLVRAVRYLAGDVGLRQFLDIGTGIPNADNVHAVARSVAPTSRIVYVDNDPIVLAHAHVLMRGETSTTSYVDGDLREPDKVLEQAATTLDLGQPVGLVLVGILHVVPDEDDPFGIVARLLGALAPGSHLVVSHLPKDIEADKMAEMASRSRQMMREPFVMRTRDEVARFFAGLDMVDPGLVQVDRWRPDVAEHTPGDWITPLYAGVGRKPGPNAISR